MPARCPATGIGPVAYQFCHEPGNYFLVEQPDLGAEVVIADQGRWHPGSLPRRLRDRRQCSRPKACRAKASGATIHRPRRRPTPGRPKNLTSRPALHAVDQAITQVASLFGGKCQVFRPQVLKLRDDLLVLVICFVQSSLQAVGQGEAVADVEEPDLINDLIAHDRAASLLAASKSLMASLTSRRSM